MEKKNTELRLNNEHLSHSFEIVLKKPVLVKGYSKMGVYIHARNYTDQALFYQSYRNNNCIIAQDKYLKILPGRARCGVDPWNGTSGWWRSLRGLAGSVSYYAIRKNWSTKTHKDFPKSFKRIVLILLVLWRRNKKKECTLFNMLALEEVFLIIEKMEWDWFENNNKYGKARAKYQFDDDADDGGCCSNCVLA